MEREEEGAGGEGCGGEGGGVAGRMVADDLNILVHVLMRNTSMVCISLSLLILHPVCHAE